MVIWLWYISKGNKCYLFELTCIWISRHFWGKNSWGCWVRYESLSLFISYLLPNLLLEQLPMYRYIVSYLPFALSNQKDSTWWNAHNVAIRWVAGPQLKRHTSIVLLFNTPPMASNVLLHWHLYKWAIVWLKYRADRGWARLSGAKVPSVRQSAFFSFYVILHMSICTG